MQYNNPMIDAHKAVQAPSRHNSHNSPNNEKTPEIARLTTSPGSISQPAEFAGSAMGHAAADSDPLVAATLQQAGTIACLLHPAWPPPASHYRNYSTQLAAAAFLHPPDMHCSSSTASPSQTLVG
jgi:hypothetical protein